ncbi:hypothetical protein CEXT_357221 [Caerostris extrusa]|uniref:Uncharacterized protein n=1 Tax=Caerostris extrusa TaxID=172846 RepID=A0AAV4SUP1_CAEEX|nr:hypothetical protein CEXT_357221 [Caerostris extrusa]
MAKRHRRCLGTHRNPPISIHLGFLEHPTDFFSGRLRNPWHSADIPTGKRPHDIQNLARRCRRHRQKPTIILGNDPTKERGFRCVKTCLFVLEEFLLCHWQHSVLQIARRWRVK